MLLKQCESLHTTKPQNNYVLPSLRTLEVRSVRSVQLLLEQY